MFLYYGAFAQKDPQEICDTLIKKSIQATHSREFAKSLSYLGEAQTISKGKNWYKIDFLILNNYGHTYMKMLEYTKAGSYFLKGYELAMQEKQPLDEMTVLNNIAIVYIKINDLEKAAFYFKKSFEIAKTHQIKAKIGLYACNLAQLNYDLKKNEIASSYIEIALQNLEPESRARLSAMMIQNSILINQNQNQKAIDNFNQLLFDYSDVSYIDERIKIKILLAQALIQQNKFKEAEEILAAAESENEDIEVRKEIFEKKSDLYIHSNQLEKAIKVKDSIISINQRISKMMRNEMIENATLKFELSESKFALENQTLKSQIQKRVYLFILITVFLIALVITLFFYKKNAFNAQKKLIAENTLKIKNLELDNEINRSKLLEKEIEEKNNQLSSKIIFQTTRNELLESVIETLTGKPEIASNKPIFDIIRDLKNHLKQDAKWDDYQKLFENVNNDFIHQLIAKHPDLNSNDIRFISYLYLNLNTNEIASFLNISTASCRKRKERLYSKLNIEKSINLNEYFQNLHKY